MPKKKDPAPKKAAKKTPARKPAPPEVGPSKVQRRPITPKPRAQSFQSHPWHGVSPGDDLPEYVTVYIEIVPQDAVKYETDKATGILRLDRPQRFSSQCPTLYGFIPRTFCDVEIAERAAERTKFKVLRGDGDPLDICVLTEKVIPQGNFLLRARPVGGLRMIDGGEADDKIIAVLVDDLAYGHVKDLDECPPALIDRLEHYFLTYKQLPGESKRRAIIAERYDVKEAHEVIIRSLRDYEASYGI